ncbi:hypothetical protein Scani_10770 [Streptomyces caniferus]|uniref:Uncharacterized protein n=1 Tax=Streptomyces caniferus TaxID=285557 RepID=A0A640S0X3_9ACTN|nr:hypothetical protein Scani_10770 [Streptomyces caniferus]
MQLGAGRGVQDRDDEDREDQQRGSKAVALRLTVGRHNTSRVRDTARRRTGTKVPGGAAGPAVRAPGTGTPYSQPLSRAVRTASARLRAPVFWMAVER